MKIHLINLDRSPDRLAVSSGLLRDAGFEYDRVPAVDGRLLTPAEISGKCRRLRFFLTNGRRAKINEFGCALSHVRACLLVADGPDPFAAVMEDDAYLDADAFRSAEELIAADNRSEIPTVWLLNHRCLVPDPGRPAIVRLLDTPNDVANTWGAYGYVANRAGAALMAKINTPVHYVADAWPSFARRGVDVKVVFPTACFVRNGPSTMERTRVTRGTWEWYKRFGWFRYRVGFWFDQFVCRVASMFRKK